MNTAPTDPAHLNWDDVRDAYFFRITALIFSSQFCFGASTLLATYDDCLLPSCVSLQDHRRDASLSPAVDVPQTCAAVVRPG